MKKVIVCGAGIGGMVSAIQLAHKGYEVSIFEKNNFAGGKLGEFKKDGFRFDTGPSKLIMPYVFTDFFEDTGKEITEYLTMRPLESSCRYFWHDGSAYDNYADAGKKKNELDKIFGETERNNFFRNIDYGKRFYELTKNNFLEEEFKVKNYVSRDTIRNFGKFISGKSMNDIANKFFKDFRLKQMFNSYATYNGSNPYLAPQLFSIIPYIENNYGTWYISGGISQISNAVEKICKELNIDINYGKEFFDLEEGNRFIRKLFFRDDKNSVTEVKDFDYVVSNFTNSRQLLIDEDYFEMDDWSSSAFVMLIGVNRRVDELKHHNILFSKNYEKEFIDIFEKKIPADDMTIYISISKKVEPDDAPSDSENWFVFVNAPSLSKNFKWNDEEKEIYKNKIIAKIENFIQNKIKEQIAFCEIITPEDFSRMYNSEHGSLYGLSSNSIYTIMKRPKNRSKKFRNLFFAGGNVHPGGGVPLSFLSGKIVSKIIQQEV